MFSMTNQSFLDSDEQVVYIFPTAQVTSTKIVHKKPFSDLCDLFCCSWEGAICPPIVQFLQSTLKSLVVYWCTMAENFNFLSVGHWATILRTFPNYCYCHFQGLLQILACSDYDATIIVQIIPLLFADQRIHFTLVS